MRIILFLIGTLLLGSGSAFAQTFHLLIGTYTQNGSKGIYVYRFNAATGTAEWVSNTDSLDNPSFLAVSPDRKYVYAVNETGGDQPGGVTALSFDKGSGKLSVLNRQPSGGDHPCYVTITRDGKWVIAGNYTGGNLSLLPVAKDGSLQPYVQLVQHEGTGANKERQEKAHVHATVLSPDQRYVYVPDLGMDKVMAYRFQPAAEKPLQPAQPVFVRSEPGSGPRHFTFHPNGKWAYLVEELTGTVVAYRYANGKLTSLDRKATHPNTYTGAKGSADIHVSPDGRFLYASNRGDANTLAIFAIDSRTGKLTLKGYQPTLGVHPRNFAIDPSGNFLLVANRDSNAIVVFRRNPKTGLLRATGKTIEVPSPVCLKLFR